MLVLRRIHDIPILWDDECERARVARIGEICDADHVIGFAEILDVDLYGERRLFLRTHYDDADND